MNKIMRVRLCKIQIAKEPEKALLSIQKQSFSGSLIV